MKKTGAQIVIDFIKHHEVDTVFGYPGGAVLPIYDELYKAKINHILTRHEQGAIHAAEGYAKSTGKVGIVIATSGPGATNLVTGLSDAKLDSVPIIAITGQVATNLIGTDAFQEADIYGISIPITKFNRLVKNADDLASTLEEAYIISQSGRPGPVLIDIPKDVQNTLTSNIEYHAKQSIKDRFAKVPIQGDLDNLIDAINQAQRPLFYVGGGLIISDAAKELFELSERASIPVTTTLMGLGAFPSKHQLSLGMLGMHGTKYANYGVGHCDLLIALGARFDDRVTGKLSDFASQAKIAHVDIDKAEIGKIVKIDYPIVGDLKEVLQAILPKIVQQPRTEWVAQLNSWKSEHPLKYNQEPDKIKPQHVLQEVNRQSKGEAIIATDVGQHQMWSAQYLDFNRPRTFLTSGGLGTMGFGFPAAIGAKLGNLDKTVILIAGDGSFQMNIQELATVAMYNINVKIVLINNGFLGMVRQWQEMFHDENYAHSHLFYNPDFIKLAEAYGLPAMRISKEDEIQKGIEFLLGSDKTSILEVLVPWEEKVFPMVPAGASISDMIDIDD